MEHLVGKEALVDFVSKVSYSIGLLDDGVMVICCVSLRSMKHGIDSMEIEVGFGFQGRILFSLGRGDIWDVDSVEGVLQEEIVEEKVHVYLVKEDFPGVGFSIFDNYKLIGIFEGGGALLGIRKVSGV